MTGLFLSSRSTPGGSTTQLQYNNGGVFGGISGATTDGTDLTLTGPLTAGLFIPSSATVPTNGMYLSTTNTLAWSTNSSNRLTLSGSGLTSTVAVISSNTNGWELLTGAASSTAPTFIPNKSAATTGIGAQASGNISLIVGAAEIARVVSTGLTIISGKALTLGNAATTGLTPGVLAATTNATIVITDSAGQAYRIPCII